jgi:hypothetical protein
MSLTTVPHTTGHQSLDMVETIPKPNMQPSQPMTTTTSTTVLGTQNTPISINGNPAPMPTMEQHISHAISTNIESPPTRNLGYLEAQIAANETSDEVETGNIL